MAVREILPSCPPLIACCHSKKTATLTMIVSIGVIVFGILATIGSLHPSSALGLLGNPIKAYGAGIILGIGILGVFGSLAIFCRKEKPSKQFVTQLDQLKTRTKQLEDDLNKVTNSIAEIQADLTQLALNTN